MRRVDLACRTSKDVPVTVGEVLVKRKKVSEAQFKEAQAARKPSERIENCLVRLGFITERDYLTIYSEQLSIPLIDLTDVEIDPELLKQTPSKVVHRDRVVPIDRNNGTIRVATNNPFNLYAFDELRMLMGARIETVLATGEEISRGILARQPIGLRLQVSPGRRGLARDLRQAAPHL